MFFFRFKEIPRECNYIIHGFCYPSNKFYPRKGLSIRRCPRVMKMAVISRGQLSEETKQMGQQIEEKEEISTRNEGNFFRSREIFCINNEGNDNLLKIILT